VNHQFLKEWAAWEPRKAPYLFPGDDLPSSATVCFNSPEAYIDSPQFSQLFDPKDVTIHLGLHPMPMLGNLSKAKVVFLLQNPGMKPGDYYAEHKRGDYWEALRRSTQQKLTGEEYPFLFLNPAFSWHSGFLWWTRKLNPIIQGARRRNGGSAKDALRWLASRVASIELYPYRSRMFKLPTKVREHLKSAELAKAYVRNELARNATSRKVLFVVMRRAKEWGISGMGVKTLGPGAARGAHLSKPIAQAVLAHLGLR